ncbi:hypothetical protein BN1211_1694 [Cyberlindnera jadinii]|uniref:Uncharacterized protein n=1 Tax=Cyberlindnera jadinii (strain ATCC 18201 / CBS 1600 / BCRC 20928 / JCM 3617 / NBRC 0987 / NRRL Y-1542) TaxID=983966 RepID=A0A0H5CBF0_CYBJN|nr:hypothetical protein BN1211_1694 [Cyberlindnera jadinii]
MGWFNSGKKEEEKVSSGSNTLADGVVVSVQDVPATVDKFVAESPLSVYLIDGANENGGQT